MPCPCWHAVVSLEPLTMAWKFVIHNLTFLWTRSCNKVEIALVENQNALLWANVCTLKYLFMNSTFKLQVKYNIGDIQLLYSLCLHRHIFLPPCHGSHSCFSTQTGPQATPHCHISPSSNGFILEMCRERKGHNANKCTTKITSTEYRASQAKLCGNLNKSGHTAVVKVKVHPC